MYKIEDFNDIEGFLSDQDKLALQKYSKKTQDLSGNFLEVGPYRGLSSLCLLSEMKEDKYLFSIDIDLNNEFIKNIKRFGFIGRVKFVEENIKNIAPYLKEEKFCLEFFDHDHSYELTEFCAKSFVDNLIQNGFMIFHDYRHFKYPGGTKYINSLRDGLIDCLKFVEIGGCCAIFQKV